MRRRKAPARSLSVGREAACQSWIGKCGNDALGPTLGRRIRQPHRACKSCDALGELRICTNARSTTTILTPATQPDHSLSGRHQGLPTTFLETRSSSRTYGNFTGPSPHWWWSVWGSWLLGVVTPRPMVPSTVPRAVPYTWHPVRGVVGDQCRQNVSQWSRTFVGGSS